MTAPGYANAEILAATLRAWARRLRAADVGWSDLDGAPADLDNAAAWVERTVDHDRAGLLAALRAMRRQQEELWASFGQAEGPRYQRSSPRVAGHKGYLAGLAAAIELVESGVPSVQVGG